MTDSIDRNSLLDDLKRIKPMFHNKVGPLEYLVVKLIEKVEEMPSTESEIIRCKDCKYAHLTYDGKCKYCDNWTDEYEIPEELYLDGDFYCGYAERRENE